MALLVSVFSVAKRGGALLENRDAAWPRPTGDPTGLVLASRVELKCSQSPQFIGVADGASEGVLAGDWAKILLRAVRKSGSPVQNSDDLQSIIGRGIETWSTFKNWRSKRGRRPLTNLPPWLEGEAVANGAFTTLCGAWSSGSGSWSCIAVGDSCLFHTRHNELLESWPLKDSADFDNSPYLIGSDSLANIEMASHVQLCILNPEREDKIFIATDALAAWIILQLERGDFPWGRLASFDPEAEPNEFYEFIEDLRDAGQIRNDDTTLLAAAYLPDFQ